MEQTHENIEKQPNLAKEDLRKVLSSEQGLNNLKRFFDKHRKRTSQGEYYDLNGDNCRGLIHRAAATLMFLAYPSDSPELHLFPDGCDKFRQQFLYNAFYRVCIPTDQILFPEREEKDDPVVIINGNDYLEAKRERVEKLGASDLVLVTELISMDDIS